jgi:hypothetical protein
MKIAAVCCTYLRPKQLGYLIRCFERQDYADRELVILDDAGQYEPAAGDRWRLVSVKERFATLGEKRNAAVGYVSADVEALAVWDDDDLYLPWALSASVAALRQAAWSRPSVVLHPQPDGSLRPHHTGGLYHGGWAYQRELFERCGGYPAMNNGEDQALAARFVRARTSQADPVGLGYQPFYIYIWGSGPHLSGMGPDGYRTLGAMPVEKATLVPADPPGIDLQNPQILPGVQPRVF